MPVLDIERELVVRLEDQGRAVTENDLRDMMAFITVLPSRTALPRSIS